MSKKNRFYIGKGRYLVRYRKPKNQQIVDFQGYCENFDSMGTSVFWSEENEQMLMIPTKDIYALYPIDFSWIFTSF